MSPGKLGERSLRHGEFDLQLLLCLNFLTVRLETETVLDLPRAALLVN